MIPGVRSGRLGKYNRKSPNNGVLSEWSPLWKTGI